jgi:hypothetical protein
MKAGDVVFSPIVHCHEVAAKFNMPTNFDFWQRYCLNMLEQADVLDVLMIPGWEISKGVTAEIEYAMNIGIDVRYIHGTTHEVVDTYNALDVCEEMDRW